MTQNNDLDNHDWINDWYFPFSCGTWIMFGLLVLVCIFPPAIFFIWYAMRDKDKDLKFNFDFDDDWAQKHVLLVRLGTWARMGSWILVAIFPGFLFFFLGKGLFRTKDWFLTLIYFTFYCFSAIVIHFLILVFATIYGYIPEEFWVAVLG